MTPRLLIWIFVALLLSVNATATITWVNGTQGNITFIDASNIDAALTGTNIAIVNSTGKYYAVLNTSQHLIGTANAITLANCTAANMYSGYTSCTNLIDQDLDAAAWQTSSVGTDSFPFSIRMDLGTTVYTGNISLYTCGDGSGPGSCNNGEFNITVSGDDVNYYPLFNFTQGSKAYNSVSWWNNTMPLQSFRYIKVGQNRSASGLWMTELQMFPAQFLTNTTLYTTAMNISTVIDKARLITVDNTTSPTLTTLTYSFCNATGGSCVVAAVGETIDFSPDIVGLTIKANYITGNTARTPAIKNINFLFEQFFDGQTIGNVQNNATATTTTGSSVNFSGTITSTGTLSHCWFEHNDTGTFVNATKVGCSSVYNMNYTLQVTALPYKQVCGRFGANDSLNLIIMSGLTCFTVADLAKPNVTGLTSNLSSSIINNRVRYWASATDNINLSYYIFGFNATGTWVNDTAVLIGNVSFNITVNKTIPNIPGYRICAVLYTNDTANNFNHSLYCFTTPPMADFNVTLFDRRNNSRINGFNVTINTSTESFTAQALTGTAQFQVNISTYTIKINSTTYGYTIFPYSLAAHTNLSVNLTNFSLVNKPTETLDSQTVVFGLAFTTEDAAQMGDINLVFNGTAYNTTRTNTDVATFYNYTLNPLSANNFSTVYEFYWNYTVLGTNRRSEAYNLTVNRVLLSNCSPTGNPNNVTINISFFNEDTVTSPLNANLQAEFHLYTTTRSVFYNATFNLARNESSYAFCINPQNTTVTTDAMFSYTTNGGFTHRYYLNIANLTNTTTYIQAYNVNNQVGYSDLKLTTRYLSNYQPFKNIITSLQRKYVSEGLYRTVQMDKSGDQGLMFFDIKEQDTDYRIIFIDENNSVLKVTDSFKFVCTSGVCDVTYQLNPAASASTVEVNPIIIAGINNATNIISIQWIDTTGLAININPIVTKETLEGTIVLCNQTLSGSSGSLNCNVSGRTGDVKVSINTVTSAGTKKTYVAYFNIQAPTLGDLVGREESAWWTAGLVMMTAAAGLTNPLLGVIFTIIGLIIASLTGILSTLSTTMLIGFATMGIVVGLIIRRVL